MGTIIARNDTFMGGLDLIWTRVGKNETFEEPSSPLFGVGANLKLTASIVTAIGGVRIPVGPLQSQPVWNSWARGTSPRKYRSRCKPRCPAFPFRRPRPRTGSIPSPGSTRITASTTNGSSTPRATAAASTTARPRRAIGAVGYNWTQSIATTLGYRVLYTYDKETNANGSYRLLQWMYGPFAAIKYTF